MVVLVTRNDAGRETHDTVRGGDERRTPAEGEQSLGTTVVGVVASEAVVLASDRRASLGTTVSSKSVEKLVPVGDGAALAFTGSVSGAQDLAATLQSERTLYETRRDTRMSVAALASLTGTEMREQPRGVRHLLGGTDAEGPQLYSFDRGGAALAHPFAADGSGAGTAYGVLEAGFESELPVDDARSLAAAAVRAATERDLASGNGLCLATIDTGPVEVETFPGYGPADEWQSAPAGH